MPANKYYLSVYTKEKHNMKLEFRNVFTYITFQIIPIIYLSGRGNIQQSKMMF